MKTTPARTKSEKLNWKPLKEITSVKVNVSTLKGQKTGKHQINDSKILIP